MKFISFIKENSTLLEDEDLNCFVERNELIKELIDYMNSFYDSYNIDLNNERDNIDIIINTFLNSVIILYKHIQNETGWSDSSLKDYISVVRKILEFLTYIINLDDNQVNEIYLVNYNKKYNNYYDFLTKLAHEKNNNFKIIKGKIINDLKNSRNYILIKSHDNNTKIEGKYCYRPIFKHTLTSPTSFGQNHIEYYFKTKDEDENHIRRIFEFSDSKGSTRKSKGGFRGKSISLETYEIVNYIANKDLYIKDIDSSETKNELSEMIEKEVLSPSLSEETAISVNSNFFEAIKNNNIESNYKQFLINNAISNSYINKSLNFRNDNTKPSLPKLRNFLLYLMNTVNDDLFIGLMIFSLVFGFSIEKIIYAILGFDRDLVYIKKKNSISILELNINKNLFSNFEDMKQHNISLKTIKKGRINLIDEFERKWLNLKTKLERFIIENMTNVNSDDNIFNLFKIHYNKDLPFDINLLNTYVKKCQELNDFDEIKEYTDKNFEKRFISQIGEVKFTEYYIKKFLEEKKAYLTSIKNKYSKSITLNSKNISSLFLYYYRIYNPQKNDFSILFTQNISKNDEAKLTYAVIPERFIEYEKWIYELTTHLGLDEYFNKNALSYIPLAINYDKKVGSNNFIPSWLFKKIISQLNSLSFEDEIICLNICMIYLRYIFSIQLVSRDIIESSVDLSQISEYFNILTIQEKNKSLKSGKKILPLTDSTIINIATFYNLKQQYNISSYYPILIEANGNEIPATRINIAKFFENLNERFENSISDNIITFTKYTKLNFGRHIITSELLEKGIKLDYIDACMNHSTLGKEDQGMYSLFDNKDYDKTIKKTIEEIENEYIPLELTVKDFLCNLKT